MSELIGPDERRDIERLRRALALGSGSAFHLIVGDTPRVVDAALAEALPGLAVRRAAGACRLARDDGPRLRSHHLGAPAERRMFWDVRRVELGVVP